MAGKGWKITFAAAGLVLLATATPALAAGEGLPPLVQDIGIALFLSGFLAILFARIKFPAIAGFIVAGIIAGPLGFRLVTDPANIDTISQLGFVLLLFMIGLELNFTKLLKSGRTLLTTGLLQFPLIVAFGIVTSYLLGLIGFSALFPSHLSYVYFGMVIAFSSTLLVVKLFQEAFELDTVPGRIALGLLVIEDIWAIVVILLQPNLESPQILPIVGSFLGIAVLVVLAVVISRTLVPMIFRWIARSPEIILVGAISWCFAVVFLGASFDTITEFVFGRNFHVSVGPGMSALIAGATIASLPYATEIVTKVGVVRDFFITLFFIGLGLAIPALSGWSVPLLALALALAAFAVRQVIVFPLLYLTGLDQRNAEVTAIRLAQMSEFSLVIAFLGVQEGHLTRDLSSAIVFAFVITALATTPLYHAAYRIHAAVAPVLRALGFKDPPASVEEEKREYRLALLGFHRVASSLLYEIAREDPALAKDTLVIDFNVSLHDEIRTLGAHVEYGDLSNPDTLHHAGVDRARVIISTIPDDLMRGIDNRRLVENVRRLNPSALIIANAITFADCRAVYEAGADYVYLSRLEAARGLNEALGHALNGTLSDYRAARESEDGQPDSRIEVLR